jgi:hypothetical protein
MSKDIVLNERPSEELRKQVQDGLRALLRDLLAASHDTHAAAGMAVLIPNAEEVAGAAIEEDLDRIGNFLNECGQNLRSARCAWMVLAERAKKGT